MVMGSFSIASTRRLSLKRTCPVATSSIKGAANLFLQVEGKSADGEAVLWDDPQ